MPNEREGPHGLFLKSTLENEYVAGSFLLYQRFQQINNYIEFQEITTLPSKAEGLMERRTYMNINCVWHHEQRHQQISDGEAEDEEVDGGLKSPIPQHGDDDEQVTEDGDHRNQNEQQAGVLDRWSRRVPRGGRDSAEGGRGDGRARGRRPRPVRVHRLCSALKTKDDDEQRLAK